MQVSKRWPGILNRTFQAVIASVLALVRMALYDQSKSAPVSGTEGYVPTGGVAQPTQPVGAHPHSRHPRVKFIIIILALLAVGISAMLLRIGSDSIDKDSTAAPKFVPISEIRERMLEIASVDRPLAHEERMYLQTRSYGGQLYQYGFSDEEILSIISALNRDL
jgi:hypothetical protein